MLVVIEGTDGSGKSTQMSLLCSRLDSGGVDYHVLDFPRYDKPSGVLAKMYLNGEFGSDPRSVNPYVASSFYAVDRIVSYLQDWRGIYESGKLIISDRYTTSNATHNGSKFPPEERASFFKWLFEYEYGYLGLPCPDLTLLLDMPVDCAMSLMSGRERERDIHETDSAYLELCRESALQAAELYGWKVVSCAENGRVRTKEDINEEIYKIIREIIC